MIKPYYSEDNGNIMKQTNYFLLWVVIGAILFTMYLKMGELTKIEVNVTRQKYNNIILSFLAEKWKIGWKGQGIWLWWNFWKECNPVLERR